MPIFFEGANSVGFQLAGMLHPGLRIANLPRELLNKRGRRIRMRIGRPVPPATLQSFSTAREAIEYLRCRTYLLDDAPATSVSEFRLPLLPTKRRVPVAPARATDDVAAEIAALMFSAARAHRRCYHRHSGTRDMPRSESNTC